MERAASIQDEDLYLLSERQGRRDVRVKVGRPPDFVASGSVTPQAEVMAGQLCNRDLEPSSRAVPNALQPPPKS
jgi:hypothetical protein